MNRNKLKAYAPKARRDFIKAVTDRAAVYGLTKDRIEPVEVKGDVAIIGGKPFPKDVAEKRKQLEERIAREGFDQVMEAMAYTWFNRFVAIRYMEAHGYLEHGYKVLGTTNHTNDTNKDFGVGIPDILRYAEHVELPGLDREKVVELKLAGNKDEELYRMLLIAQCNALHKAMPFLFERIGDATELLLPENLLHSDSLIRRMVKEIPEEEWEEVEIIGWLYQFYISEKKDQVIGKVVKSEDIPAATQLFTPNWIVKYMVQNTLGRQWMATYPNSALSQKMEYYIEPAEQTPEVEEQLKAITPDSLDPEEMTLLDPACGSGHILVEAYDLFKTIYQERGYRAKDIPRLILQKNLYGLEIDDRAAQLAAFALMMKAREDDRRIFDRGAKLNVLAIQNTPELSDEALEILTTPVEPPHIPFSGATGQANRDPSEIRYANTLSISRGKPGSTGQADDTDTTDIDENEESVSIHDIRGLLELFEHGKTFGSLIRVPKELEVKLPVIAKRVEDVLAHGVMFAKATAEAIIPIVREARILAGRYDATVTNPPYMGIKAFNNELRMFVGINYPNTKNHLFACFVERIFEVAKCDGEIGLMTPFVWMLLKSYEGLRDHILEEKHIHTLVKPEYHSFFESAYVPISTYALHNGPYSGSGVYFDLSEFYGAEQQSVRLLEAINSRESKWQYYVDQSIFRKIPGHPIAYWISERICELFERELALRELAAVKQGLATGENERFLRLWYEVSIERIGFSHKNVDQAKSSGKRWFPYNKGGDFRKWYGNQAWLVNWENDGAEIRTFGTEKGGRPRSRAQNTEFYFRPSLSWSKITVGEFSVRYFGAGFLFDVAGCSIFPQDEDVMVALIGILNSPLTNPFLKELAQTLNYEVGQVASVPVIASWKEYAKEARAIVNNCIENAKKDWDDRETSWDFQMQPIIRAGDTLSESWHKWELKNEFRIQNMKELEESNNRLVIAAYGLEGKLYHEVHEDQITLCRANREEDIRNLSSYAVGCMMGRYSLDAPGLIYAHSGNDQFWEIYCEKHNKPNPNPNTNQCHPYDPPAPLNRVPSEGVQPGWSKFPPDEDGIIAITDIDWFPDDAANRFIQFISVVWPQKHLEENLQFIADSLSPKKSETPRETIRRYMATGFFKHHMKMYKKRPIYWLFTSGKLRAFQCLVYLHRYNEGTLSRMRTEYVIPLQGKFTARVEQLSGDIDAATSTAHRKKLEREKGKLQKQKVELQASDEKLRHYADQRIGLDLDDGVKVNYGKFGDLLAEVRAVTGKK